LAGASDSRQRYARKSERIIDRACDGPIARCLNDRAAGRRTEETFDADIGIDEPMIGEVIARLFEMVTITAAAVSSPRSVSMRIAARYDRSPAPRSRVRSAGRRHRRSAKRPNGHSRAS